MKFFDRVFDAVVPVILIGSMGALVAIILAALTVRADCLRSEDVWVEPRSGGPRAVPAIAAPGYPQVGGGIAIIYDPPTSGYTRVQCVEHAPWRWAWE